MSFSLSQKSLKKLQGVHPDLVKVVVRAIELSTQDFSVLEGVRTLERQKQLVAKGASRTLNSRHIPGSDGLAKAVDLVPYPVSWDWDKFHPIAKAMKQAAKELKVPLEWGGDWKTFKDGPHFQLPHKQYP